MKKLNLLFKTAFVSLVLLSCSSDDSSDNDDSSSSNEDQTITIEDTSFNVDKGIFEDYGVDNEFVDGIFVDHYNVDIYISNGEIENLTEDGETYIEFSEDSEIIFATDFYSNSTDNFEFGTFDIVTDENENNFDNTANFTYETYIDIYNANDDSEFTYEAKSGTITISDNGNNNYTVIVDATFEKFNEDDLLTVVSEVDIDFTFTGNFTYSDQTDQ